MTKTIMTISIDLDVLMELRMRKDIESKSAFINDLLRQQLKLKEISKISEIDIEIQKQEQKLIQLKNKKEIIRERNIREDKKGVIV